MQIEGDFCALRYLACAVCLSAASTGHKGAQGDREGKKACFPGFSVILSRKVDCDVGWRAANSR